MHALNCVAWAHLLVNQGSYWQAVEAVSEGAPQADVIPALALVIEAINAIDRGAFVVPAKEEEVLRILDLCIRQNSGRQLLLLESVLPVAAMGNPP